MGLTLIVRTTPLSSQNPNGSRKPNVSDRVKIVIICLTDIQSRYLSFYDLRRGGERRFVLYFPQETGESYAVKIIDVSHDAMDADGLDLREQTMREVNILRLVQGHKYIIDLVDVFESPTYIFLVFELCPNGELFDYLTSQVAGYLMTSF